MPKIKDEHLVPLDTGFSVVSFSVGGPDWAPVEAAAGVTFTADQQKRLEDAMDSYFTAKKFEQMRPVTKDVNSRLDAIADNATGLADALHFRDEAGEVAVGAVWPWGSVPEPTVIQAMLRKLALVARWHRAGGGGGRRRKDAPRELVRIAAPIWHEAGGKTQGVHWDNYKREYRGKLLNMIKVIIKQVTGKQATQAETRGIVEAIKEFNKRQ